MRGEPHPQRHAQRVQRHRPQKDRQRDARAGQHAFGERLHRDTQLRPREGAGVELGLNQHSRVVGERAAQRRRSEAEEQAREDAGREGPRDSLHRPVRRADRVPRAESSADDARHRLRDPEVHRVAHAFQRGESDAERGVDLFAQRGDRRVEQRPVDCGIREGVAGDRQADTEHGAVFARRADAGVGSLHAELAPQHPEADSARDRARDDRGYRGSAYAKTCVYGGDVPQVVEHRSEDLQRHHRARLADRDERGVEGGP